MHSITQAQLSGSDHIFSACLRISCGFVTPDSRIVQGALKRKEKRKLWRAKGYGARGMGYLSQLARKSTLHSAVGISLLTDRGGILTAGQM